MPVQPAGGNKRPYEAAAGNYSAGQAYANNKRHHMGHAAAAGQQAGMAAVPALAAGAVPRESVYRMVLDVVDTALIIGRGGATVRQIELATGGGRLGSGQQAGEGKQVQAGKCQLWCLGRGGCC